MVRKFNPCLWLLFILFGVQVAYSQQEVPSATGIIRSQSGNPIELVTVRAVRNTDTLASVISDSSGKFVFKNLSKGKVSFVFDCVGFNTQTVTGYDIFPGETISMLIDLVPVEGSLDQVVVVAYGTSTKRELTSAVSTLDMKSVAPLPVQSISDGLAGRMPGLFITSNNGAPGNKSSISIRGGGTPLFVIDNILRSQNDFENLNPNDIATFSILKDAAATALYGQAAGNGVVIVTTKRGKTGIMNVNYSFNYILSQPTVRPKKMSSYEKALAINAVYDAEGRTVPYADSVLQFYKDQTKPFQYPNTDWQDIAMRSYAPESRHDLSLTAGSKYLTYYGSLSYYNQGSILKTDNNNNRRITYRMNTVSDFDKIGLKITSNIDGFVEKNTVPNSATAGSYSAIYSHIQDKSPMDQAYNDLGLPSTNTTDNPAVELSPLSGYNKSESRVLNAMLTFDWATPIKGLNLKLNGNYNMWNSKSKSWNASAPTYANGSTTAIQGNPPTLYQIEGDGYSYTLQGLVSYNKDYGDHHLGLTGVYEETKTASNAFSGSREQFQIIFDQFLAGPTLNQKIDGSESVNAKEGIIGRLNYNYKSKYFLDFSVRDDGNDAFPPGPHRWGSFYAGSVGWIISEEGFMESLKSAHVFDYLKFRGSYGEIGSLSGVGAFAYIPGYSVNANGYVVDGVPVQGTSEPGSLPSQDYSWYSIKNRDLGLDFGSFNNRLQGTLDYFYERTTGFVTADPRFAGTLGIGLPPINFDKGATRKEGLEFNLNWNSLNGAAFTYKLGVNFSYFNTLTEYSAADDDATLQNPYTRVSGTTGGYLTTGYYNLGFYPDNNALLEGPRRISSVNVVGGDLKYEDVNGDGKIDGSDFRRIGSNTFPRLNYGITADLGYKGFYLNAVIMGSGSRDRYFGNVIQGSSSQGILVYPFQKDYWTPTNMDALYPRQVSSAGVNGSNNYVSSDFWILSSGFMRLKYLQIGYDFKIGGLMKHLPFNQLKAFVSGTNLITLSKSLDYFIDPEADPNNYNYPIQRTISFGINVGF